MVNKDEMVEEVDMSARIGQSAGCGMRGRLARRALMLAYARVFSVWLEDDLPDQDATLAELDKRLDQLERLARLGDRLAAGLPARARAT